MQYKEPFSTYSSDIAIRGLSVLSMYNGQHLSLSPLISLIIEKRETLSAGTLLYIVS